MHSADNHKGLDMDTLRDQVRGTLFPKGKEDFNNQDLTWDMEWPADFVCLIREGMVSINLLQMLEQKGSPSATKLSVKLLYGESAN